jgi:DNA-binding FadR family transcriptional regulator
LAAHVRILDAIERQDPDAAAEAAQATLAPTIVALNEYLAQ